MGLNTHERFECHNDVSSPETIGDAKKIENILDNNGYDDLFDERLSQIENCQYTSKEEFQINNENTCEDKFDSVNKIRPLSRMMKGDMSAHLNNDNGCKNNEQFKNIDTTVDAEPLNLTEATDFGIEKLNTASLGDAPKWVKSAEIKGKLNSIGLANLTSKVDEAINNIKAGNSKGSMEFVVVFTEFGSKLRKLQETVDCGQALQNLVNSKQKALKLDFLEGSQEYNGLEIEKIESSEKIKEITKHYYNDAKILARSSKVGRDFTDHTEDHVEQVSMKSLETAVALEKAISKGRFQIKSDNLDYIGFIGNIDQSVLEGAALSHDTGMSGNGYALEYKYDDNGKKQYIKNDAGTYVVKLENNGNFNEIRENHSLNSAINILVDREKYKNIGYTDEQINMMAAECMAHSKSNSGIKNLNSKSNWSDCFDRIDAVVKKYNEDHPESPIVFERKQLELNDEKLGQLATSTLALRVGDVSRDSGPMARSQSGEVIYIDRESINDNGGTIREELKTADITRGDKRKEVISEKSRQVHAGEQNIVENHTACSEDGTIKHMITIIDGDSAPKCTQEALRDHIGEFASATCGKFKVEVNFNKLCTENGRESYEDFRVEIESDGKYDNIYITYPWDREV